MAIRATRGVFLRDELPSNPSEFDAQLPHFSFSLSCRTTLRVYMECIHTQRQSGGSRDCQPSFSRGSFPSRSSSSTLLHRHRRLPGPGGGRRWELRTIARSLSSFSSRGTFGRLSSRPAPCTPQQGLHQRGPLRGFAVALSLIARSPTRITSFCLRLLALSATDPTSHVSQV